MVPVWHLISELKVANGELVSPGSRSWADACCPLLLLQPADDSVGNNTVPERIRVPVCIFGIGLMFRHLKNR